MVAVAVAVARLLGVVAVGVVVRVLEIVAAVVELV